MLDPVQETVYSFQEGKLSLQTVAVYLGWLSSTD